MTALYKILDQVDGSFNGGTGTWHLPKNGDPGAWMPEIEGDLEPCVRGYHLCSFDNLLEWAGPTLYEAEYEGEIISCDNKVVVRKARLVRRIETWNDKNLRLFAAECAEHVLWIYEKPGGTSDAPKNAILVAREFAHGRASKEELAAARAAARDAAWDAARAAAWAAAWDAARDAAWAAARDAARAAAWDAARAAAWDAAWAAARDAAWAAARDAARAAARAAARDAARAAARDAARDAARAAARDAEQKWQLTTLRRYLELT